MFFFLLSYFKFKRCSIAERTRRVCDTNAPDIWPIPIMAKITRTIFFIPVKRSCYKKWTMCNIETLISSFLEIITNVTFFEWSNFKVQRLSTNTKILSQAIFMWNINALALTIQILLTGSKYSKRRPVSKVKVTE